MKKTARYIYQIDEYSEICEIVKAFMNSGLHDGDKVEFLNKFMHGWATDEMLLVLAGHAKNETR